MGKEKLYDRRRIGGWTILCTLFIFITSIGHAYSNGFNNADWYNHFRAFLTIFSCFYLSSRLDKIDEHISNLEEKVDYYKRKYEA